jgi:hypothetical protein
MQAEVDGDAVSEAKSVAAVAKQMSRQSGFSAKYFIAQLQSSDGLRLKSLILLLTCIHPKHDFVAPGLLEPSGATLPCPPLFSPVFQSQHPPR